MAERLHFHILPVQLFQKPCMDPPLNAWYVYVNYQVILLVHEKGYGSHYVPQEPLTQIGSIDIKPNLIFHKDQCFT
jgi:hypothetical protein